MNAIKIKTAVRCFIFAIVFFTILGGVNRLMIRKTLYGEWNTTIKIGGYSNLEKNSIDVVALGSSHAYCTVCPDVLQSEHSISAYVLATQQQTVKISYYYMKEALKTQSPKTVIFEAYMVGTPLADEDTVDVVVRDAAEPLPMSWNKLEMLADCVGVCPDKLDYYIPVLKYHSRWSELTEDDYSGYFDDVIDENMGYVRLEESAEIVINRDLPEPHEVKLPEEDLRYLEKMIELADENDIRLVLLYAPFNIGEENNNINYTLKNYCADNGLGYIDGYELFDKLELDPAADFFDGGHLNVSGSAKVSDYIGGYLTSSYPELFAGR